MVEGQYGWRLTGGKYRQGCRIIARTWVAPRLSHIYKRDGMATQITLGIGVATQQRLERDAKPSFFPRLAYGCRLDRFADIHESAR